MFSNQFFTSDSFNLNPFLYLFVMDLLQVPAVSWTQYVAREPGCDITMMNAWMHAFQCNNRGLMSHQLIKGIHKTSVQHLKNVDGGVYRSKVGTYPIFIYQENAPNAAYSGTIAGLLDFIAYWMLKKDGITHSIDFEIDGVISKSSALVVEQGKPILFSFSEGIAEDLDLNRHRNTIVSLAQNSSCKIVIASLGARMHEDPTSNASIMHAQMQIIIDGFNTEIMGANTDDKKLEIIVKHVQRIDQLHPFYDGNVRTCYILINKLLRDHGLPLTLLLNPNRLDCCTLAEVINMVKEGQIIYQQLLQHNSSYRSFVLKPNDPLLSINAIQCRSIQAFSQALCDVFHDTVLSGHVYQGCEPPPGSYMNTEGKTIAL